jgi:hypothetical protein
LSSVSISNILQTCEVSCSCFVPEIQASSALHFVLCSCFVPEIQASSALHFVTCSCVFFCVFLLQQLLDMSVCITDPGPIYLPYHKLQDYIFCIFSFHIRISVTVCLELYLCRRIHLPHHEFWTCTAYVPQIRTDTCFRILYVNIFYDLSVRHVCIYVYVCTLAGICRNLSLVLY